ncbi:hypothetical protein [Amycolatopsis panacis]|uniref:Uncharacterized protein n=1 Tax=Amycolatopsis panacis TaxID=2340917 RepID=A0A419I517_9PSEU|nr:hypothetical protein [Amycolatopsis panacis]RJQ85779.1 hypothetical protein D5S19_12735 [Amycolatopsis panacis]
MTTLEGFSPVAEVTADERARVAVGKAGARKNDRYAVSMNADGAILLVPLASIPKRELLVWENDELRASLFRGLADAAEGNARPLDWVTADDDEDDDDA